MRRVSIPWGKPNKDGSQPERLFSIRHAATARLTPLIKLAAGRDGMGADPTYLLALSGATIGSFWVGAGRSWPSLLEQGGDLVVFGDDVVSALLDEGMTNQQIVDAGTALFKASKSAFPAPEADVLEAVGNSDAQKAPSTSG